MIDVRKAAESVYTEASVDEWVNKSVFDSLPETAKTLADSLYETWEQVGDFDKTDIFAAFQTEAENDAGLRCDGCAFYAAENACVIMSWEIEPGGLCRFHVIAPDEAEDDE